MQLSARHRVVLDLPTSPVTALGDPSSVPHVVGQLVEGQGGSVSARNRPEGGAAVTVTLPLIAAPAPAGDARPTLRTA